jgi:hypothetical protein
MIKNKGTIFLPEPNSLIPVKLDCLAFPQNSIESPFGHMLESGSLPFTLSSLKNHCHHITPTKKQTKPF